MAIKAIHNQIKSSYKQIENITKKNPIEALTYSIALKIISFLIFPFFSMTSNLLFLFSLAFDVALISNYKTVYKKLEYKFLEMMDDNSSVFSRLRGQRDAINFKQKILSFPHRVHGFFEGLFKTE